MLQNISDKLKGEGGSGSSGHRWGWYLILGILALVFVAWGPTTVMDMSFGPGSYAAKVNGEKISADRMNELWQLQQPQLMASYGGDIPAEERTELQRGLLNMAVRELATTQHAREVGFRVSSPELAKAFREEESFQIDGQFSLNEARARLANAGISEQAYLDELRTRLLTNRLLGVIGVTDFLTPVESRRILGLLDEEREVRYLLLDPEKFAGNAPVEPAAIEAWYNSHQEDFAIPESVRLAYAEMLLTDVAATVTVTEDELKARYELDKAQYVQPETRNARHILIPVADEAEDAKQAARAQELHAQIQGGADFAELARANSGDTASAANGGELGWASRETYVPAFADKLFSMREGEVSEPVKTQFGYHIIKLEGIRPEVGRSFEAVRAEILAKVRNEKAGARFNSEQDRLQEQLETGGANFDTLVQEFNLRPGEVEHFARGAGGLPLGSDATLNREVFSDALINQRRIGGPVQLAEDRVTIFRVEEHRPASTRPLEEVRGEIIAALLRERGAAAALEVANKAVDELAGGKSFEQVAASLKVKAEPARFIGRGSPDLPVELRDAVFAAPRPQDAEPVRQALKTEDGTVALFQVTASRVQSVLDVPQLVELRTERELQRYTRRDIEAYINSVVGDAKVRENLSAFIQ
ncbi:MAG: peptidyl-prolyl cis-trans isomerase [Pseudomonadota bacterium]|nr:peptidyl-prolyl cis-trans isomerase [Pseudomonadota bacterium]